MLLAIALAALILGTINAYISKYTKLEIFDVIFSMILGSLLSFIMGSLINLALVPPVVTHTYVYKNIIMYPEGFKFETYDDIIVSVPLCRSMHFAYNDQPVVYFTQQRLSPWLTFGVPYRSINITGPHIERGVNVIR